MSLSLYTIGVRFMSDERFWLQPGVVFETS